MKRILITGGPTNEFIDEVMKITNMSTGSLSVDLAACAADAGCRVTLIVTTSVTGTARYEARKIADRPNVRTVTIETTRDMYEALHAASREQEPYDVVLHTAAVGDYSPAFSFRLEDLADHLAHVACQQESPDEQALASTFLRIVADPPYKVHDDSKISSNEPHLTVKLALTQKLIAHLRSWFPKATLIGAKLLENVPREHLIEVARDLAIKNDMDYILANDLAELRSGKPYRYVVDRNGFTGITLNEPSGPALLDYASEHWFGAQRD